MSFRFQTGAINAGQPVNRSSGLNAGLTAWWQVLGQSPLYGGTRIIDLCGLNHGTLTNGPVWSGGFERTWSLLFDGSDDHINAPQTINGMIGGSTEGAVVFSVYPTDVSDISIFGDDGDTGLNSFSMQDFVGTIYAGFNVGGGADYRTTATTAGNFVSGEWQRYALTFKNGGDTILYRNGAQIGTPAGSTSVLTQHTTFRLGFRAFSGSAYFAGRIEGIKFYSIQIGAGLVAAEYRDYLSGYQIALNRLRRTVVFDVGGGAAPTTARAKYLPLLNAA